ncbi:MAG: ribonuclease P protein component [Acidobacteriaceae bacterium]
MSKQLVFLKKQADFDLFRRSTTVSGRVLRIKIRHNTNQNQPRFGFIVPKKVLPKVTDRNRIKRRIKYLLEKHFATTKPDDYLIFPSKNALVTKTPELENELLRLLSQNFPRYEKRHQ